MHWTTVLFWVWAAGMVVALWSVRVAQVFAWRRPRAGDEEPQGPWPTVAVVLPIKGVDADTAENVVALLAQDYPGYRLIFSVESAEDPVLGLLREAAAKAPAGKVEVVIAGLAKGRGQKIHNQLAAVAHTAARDEVLAFVDADATPAPGWLRSLVVPLTYGPRIGATTGYRYYVPTDGHPASAIVSVINAGVGVLFGPYRRTFAWGGSMALRRPDFFGMGVYAAWQNAVSDDYVVSHVVKRRNRSRIHFVPRCLVASDAAFTWRGFLEFAVRQYRITRVCAPLVWVAAVTGPMLYLTALVYPAARAGYLWTHHDANVPASEPWRLLVMFLGLYAATFVRGGFVLYGAKVLLPAQWPAIRRTWFWMTVGYPLVQVANWAALVCSAYGKKIWWRGVRYRMVSRTRTVVERAAAGV